MLLNQAVMRANRELDEGALAGTLRRMDRDTACIELNYRGPQADERSLWLADVADGIRSEIRLEQSDKKEALYRTSESRFEIQPALKFEFDITLTPIGKVQAETPLTGPTVPGE